MNETITPDIIDQRKNGFRGTTTNFPSDKVPNDKYSEFIKLMRRRIMDMFYDELVSHISPDYKDKVSSKDEFIDGTLVIQTSSPCISVYSADMKWIITLYTDLGKVVLDQTPNQYNSEQLSCYSDNPWERGKVILNYDVDVFDVIKASIRRDGENTSTKENDDITPEVEPSRLQRIKEEMDRLTGAIIWKLGYDFIYDHTSIELNWLNGQYAYEYYVDHQEPYNGAICAKMFYCESTDVANPPEGTVIAMLVISGEHSGLCRMRSVRRDDKTWEFPSDLYGSVTCQKIITHDVECNLKQNISDIPELDALKELAKEYITLLSNNPLNK